MPARFAYFCVTKVRELLWHRQKKNRILGIKEKARSDFESQPKKLQASATIYYYEKLRR